MSEEQDKTVEPKKGKTIPYLAVGAVVAGIGGLIIVSTDLDDQFIETKSFLETLAKQAPESVERHEMVRAACGPLAHEFETMAAERGLNIQVKTTYQEIGTECLATVTSNLQETTLAFQDYDLEDTNRIERILDEMVSRDALSQYCTHFNEAVVPVLSELGLSYQLSSNMNTQGDACIIYADEPSARYPNFATSIMYYEFNEKGAMEQRYMKMNADRILDSLPVSDRRLIANQLPALLAGPAQQ